MKRIAILCAGLALAGCQTKTVQEMGYAERNELAKQIAIRCANQGYADGHPQQRACIRAEVEREVASRQVARARQDNARVAMAGAMMGMSNSFNANAAMMSQPAYRPMTCTSRPNSSWVNGPVSSVTTNCY